MTTGPKDQEVWKITFLLRGGQYVTDSQHYETLEEAKAQVERIVTAKEGLQIWIDDCNIISRGAIDGASVAKSSRSFWDLDEGDLEQ